MNCQRTIWLDRLIMDVDYKVRSKKQIVAYNVKIQQVIEVYCCLKCCIWLWKEAFDCAFSLCLSQLGCVISYVINQCKSAKKSLSSKLSIWNSKHLLDSNTYLGHVKVLPLQNMGYFHYLLCANTRVHYQGMRDATFTP